MEQEEPGDVAVEVRTGGTLVQEVQQFVTSLAGLAGLSNSLELGDIA